MLVLGLGVHALLDLLVLVQWFTGHVRPPAPLLCLQCCVVCKCDVCVGVHGAWWVHGACNVDACMEHDAMAASLTSLQARATQERGLELPVHHAARPHPHAPTPLTCTLGSLPLSEEQQRQSGGGSSLPRCAFILSNPAGYTQQCMGHRIIPKVQDCRCRMVSENSSFISGKFAGLQGVRGATGYDQSGSGREGFVWCGGAHTS